MSTGSLRVAPLDVRAILPAKAMTTTRSYRCSACNNEVDQRATVCSSVTCRKPLAFCSHCRDVSTYTLVHEGTGRLGRDVLRCDRCQRLGVRCLTWLAGGYCNGLARASLTVAGDGTGGAGSAGPPSGEGAPPAGKPGRGRPLCALCEGRVSEMARGVAGYALMGAVGLVLKRRK